MPLETVMVPIGDLVAYENNAKIHTEAQIEHIRNSIREFGFNDPVGVWTNAQGRIEIVTGHGSVLAAQKEGLTKVPCNFLDHLSDEQRREYCHVHNQTQLETGFDTEALIADMDNLSASWAEYGFSEYLFNGGFDAIEDLATEEFATNVTESEGETFGVTIVFTAEKKPLVSSYIKAVGKDEVSRLIMEEAEKWA